MIDLHADPAYAGALDVPVGVEDEVLVATEAGDVVGVVVWRVEPPLGTVASLRSAPGRDRDVDVLDALRAHAHARGVTRLVAEVAESQSALLALLRDATLLSTYMVKPTPSQPPHLPPGVDVRAMTADEYTAWERVAIDGYAEASLARSGGDRDVALRRAHESFARFLPDGAATADTRLCTLTVDGAPAGTLWIRHHRPRHRDTTPAADETFTFDIDVERALRGRGLGRAAMLAVERAALEVGDRRLGLNVFGDNTVATGLYRSLGYTPRSSALDVPLASSRPSR